MGSVRAFVESARPQALLRPRETDTRQNGALRAPVRLLGERLEGEGSGLTVVGMDVEAQWR